MGGTESQPVPETYVLPGPAHGGFTMMNTDGKGRGSSWYLFITDEERRTRNDSDLVHHRRMERSGYVCLDHLFGYSATDSEYSRSLINDTDVEIATVVAQVLYIEYIYYKSY